MQLTGVTPPNQPRTVRSPPALQSAPWNSKLMPPTLSTSTLLLPLISSSAKSGSLGGHCQGITSLSRSESANQSSGSPSASATGSALDRLLVEADLPVEPRGAAAEAGEEEGAHAPRLGAVERPDVHEGDAHLRQDPVEQVARDRRAVA